MKRLQNMVLISFTGNECTFTGGRDEQGEVFFPKY